MAPSSTTPASKPADASAGCNDAPDSLAPGEILGGKYRIDARLAEGGVGVVLRATHLDLDCSVAIKLLRPEHTGNEDAIARLLAEARIAANLRSKHVNRVLDVGRTAQGIPYLVLEYLEGSDLATYIARRSRLPLAESVDYVLQVCEALAEAHAVGIVHRDLKPENLFLAEEADGTFVLKVLDFGISKAPAGWHGGRALTNPFEVVGSPTYMSPEQVRGANVDARTDVWALGAVLYELCTGRTYFDEASIANTFKRIVDERDVPPPLEGGADAAELHRIIVRCLERAPERRYQDVVELARELAPLASDGLQGGRVAKVAAASRARLISSTDDVSPPSTVTPVALTTSRVERALVAGQNPFASGVRWKTWCAFATATLVSGYGAGRFLVQERVFAPRATAMTLAAPAPPAKVAAASPVPVQAQSDVSPAAPTSPAAATPAAAMPAASPSPKRARVSPWAKPRKVARPPFAAKTPYPAHAPVEPPSPPPAAAPRGSSEASFDAWDPKTFGGRR